MAIQVHVEYPDRLRVMFLAGVGIALMWTGSQRPVVDNQSLVPMR